MRRLSSTTSTDDGNGGPVQSGESAGANEVWVRVCSADEVKDGQLCRFVDGDNSILVANHGGEIRATDLICTHADADLSTGFLGPDGVRCPLHLSVFDLETGKPQNPPAEKPLRTFNVKIDDGQVYVRV